MLEETIERVSIFLPWEEFVAIAEVEKRHRLFAQGVDDVVVVDDLGALAGSVRPCSWQVHQVGAADEKFRAIVLETNPEPVADQTGRPGAG